MLDYIAVNNDPLGKEIVELLIDDGDSYIAEIRRKLDSSIPTITKKINRLIEDGIVMEKGKQDTVGGRKPVLYGLNPNAGYFIGVELHRTYLNIALMQFDGTIRQFSKHVHSELENSTRSFETLCEAILSYLREQEIDQKEVIAYGFNLSGRVNAGSGQSFNLFFGNDKTPLKERLEKRLGCPVFLENDSRAMTYGEHMLCWNKVDDMLFLNLTWGLGMGMIVNGKTVYGKSGYAGEIGHFPMLNNNQICRCGKVGCLETGASGQALHRILLEKIRQGASSILSEKLEQNGDISMDDILDAIQEEDVLAIECIEKIGVVLGRSVAGLINLFNPEVVVIGGVLSKANDYLMIPVVGTINKLSLHFVNKDTTVSISKLGEKAGPIGACLLSRSKILNLE